ncbi:hypothetical protein [Rhizobium leguminosarum]
MALPPFANGFQPFLRNNSDTLLAAGAGLLGGQTAPQQVAGLAQGVAGARQKNKTLEFLRQQNPELAAAVESGALTGGDAYKLFYQQKLEAQKPKNNFMAVGKNLYDASTGQWVTPPAGGGGDAEYGLNPIYGTDAEGNTGIGQVGKDGSFHVVDTKGFKPVGTTQNLNLGTTFQTRDRAGNIIATAPIDISGKNTQEEIGTAQGKAIAAAPGDLQAAQNALDMVESIRNDPYKGRGTGFSSVLNSIPGTGGYDFSNKVDQAKSGAFLTAIQQMRGLGSLSNAEGGAATAAVNRMNTATSEPEFNAALDDYEKIVRQGAARAQQRLQQGGGQVQAPPGMAPPGATSSGVKWSIEP